MSFLYIYVAWVGVGSVFSLSVAFSLSRTRSYFMPELFLIFYLNLFGITVEKKVRFLININSFDFAYDARPFLAGSSTFHFIRFFLSQVNIRMKNLNHLLRKQN